MFKKKPWKAGVLHTNITEFAVIKNQPHELMSTLVPSLIISPAVFYQNFWLQFLVLHGRRRIIGWDSVLSLFLNLPNL